MENMLVIGPLPLPLVHGEGAAATRGILVDDRTQGGGHSGAPHIEVAHQIGLFDTIQEYIFLNSFHRQHILV